MITGPSGAGKTALLDAGRSAARTGGVTLDGQSLQSISEPDLVRRVGSSPRTHTYLRRRFATTSSSPAAIAATTRSSTPSIESACTGGAARGPTSWQPCSPVGRKLFQPGSGAADARTRPAVACPDRIARRTDRAPRRRRRRVDARRAFGSGGGTIGRDRTVVVATHQRPAEGSGVSVHMEVTPEIGPSASQAMAFSVSGRVATAPRLRSDLCDRQWVRGRYAEGLRPGVPGGPHHEGARSLYINPYECVDCVRAHWRAKSAQSISRQTCQTIRLSTSPTTPRSSTRRFPDGTLPRAAPGGAYAVGRVGVDTPYVASLPPRYSPSAYISPGSAARAAGY